MSIFRAVLFFHWLHLIVGVDNFNCVEKSGGASECLLTAPTCHTRLNVTCSDRHLDIRTVDSDCQPVITADDFRMDISTVDSVSQRLITADDFHLPTIEEAWTQCISLQPGPTHRPFTSLTELDIKFSDHFIAEFPDEYFCGLLIKRLVIKGNSLNNTRKLGFIRLGYSSWFNYDAQCLTKLQTLRFEKTNFKKILAMSFCGLATLTELQLCDSGINELDYDSFDLLGSLQILDLNNNNISILPSGVFKHQQYTLLHLDMSNNRLDSQTLSQLKILRNLEFLNLEGNRIDELPIEVIQQLTKLRHLKIGNNLLTNSYGVMQFLTNLIPFEVQSNNISDIESNFVELPNLKIINIQNNPIPEMEYRTYKAYVNATHDDLSNTSYIPSYIKTAKQLKIIDLSSQEIDRINVEMFDDAGDIDVISLMYNRITDISNVFTNCSVKRLHLDYNKITMFTFDDFSFKLTWLGLTHNQIHIFHEGSRVSAMDFRWSLKTLEISHNLIRHLKYIRLPPSLNVFDASNNNISSISYYNDYIELTNNNSNSLREIHLENNEFKVICPKYILPKNQPKYFFDGNPISCSCENRWLSSASNDTNVESIQSSIANRDNLTCQYEFQRTAMQPKLIQDLTDSDIECSFKSECACDVNRVACNVQCPQHCLCHKPTLSKHLYIDCSSKDIRLPLTPSTNFNKHLKLLYIYLDNNPIYKIDYWSFQGLENTIELYLNYTSLTEMADIPFDHLDMLKLLNLEHNNLRHISRRIFKYLNSLTQLFLSHNQLQTIEPNAFPSQLQTLRLDNNQLVNYNVWELGHLTHLKRVSLHANEWTCESNFEVMFRYWCLRNVEIVEDINEIVCVHPIIKPFHMPSNGSTTTATNE